MITLYNGNQEIVLPVTDDSYSYNAVMGENSLTLYFSSEKYFEIPIGSYCNFGGERYSLKKDSNFTKQGTRNFEYTLLLETDQADLKLWKIRNPVDNRIKFSYTATPREHLELLVANANRRSSGWSVGACIDGKEVTFEYNHTYIFDGLNDFANQLGTEWQISNKTIHLRKVEYNKENPLVLSYGKGNGFKTGVGRETGDVPVEILLVQGTDKNIDFSKYGSKELLLPKSQTLNYEGRTYVTSADGLSIMNANKPLLTVHEDSLDCSEIYPSREGTVGSIVEVDAEKNFYDFIDNSIPDDLNFEDYLIEGENMTVIFQTGMLAGRGEFEVKYYHEPKTVAGKEKAGKRFEIVPQEIDGITMPDGSIFTPQPGDTYAVFGIQLPDAYVCDNATKTGASWDMFREAAKYLYEHEDKTFIFTGTLDGIWAKKRWLQIGGKIILGGYVLFSDEQFMPEGSLIRITGVKRYVNKPYMPEIELSNTTTGSSISSDLNKPGQNEVVIDDKYKDSLRFTKRRFRDAKETMRMLEDALLNFSGAINPIAIQTMQLLVGDESLQFRFVFSKANPVQVSHNITYDEITRVLHVPSGLIQHMTLDIKILSSSHKTNEYKFWQMAEYNSASLVDEDAKYYLYAKVSKTSETGTFLLSETAIKMEQISGYYHLLVGVLNSEYDGTRSFVELYGFTEILPGRVTTERIVSPNGTTYFDLVKEEIGGKIKFASGSSGLENLDEWAEVSKDISAANDSANKANNAVSDLNKYVDGAFSDSIITEAEAKAIEKYINVVKSAKADVEATYTKLYANIYLIGKPKTNLLNAKVTFMGAVDDLLKAINDAISDKKTTEAEKQNVDAKYTAFNSAYSSMSQAVEAANKAIQDTLKGYSDEYSKKFDDFIGGSFKELKDNAVQKNTIIDGGYLKNSLINTDDLIVKNIFSKNGNFKTLEDGSIEARSGTFWGYLKTNFHLVEESDAIYTKDISQGVYGYKINKELNLKVDKMGSDDGANIILPNDAKYIGSRIILHNGCYPPYTRTLGSIRFSSVCVDDGSPIRGCSSSVEAASLLSWGDPNKIKWINGIMELIGVIDNVYCSSSLLTWRGSLGSAPSNPSNGWMYYNTKDNKNYIHWYGKWNEIPAYGSSSEDLRITWKGKQDSSPTNPQKNWMFVSKYNDVYIYTGTTWEYISSYVLRADKCGWGVLCFSGVSTEYIYYS